MNTIPAPSPLKRTALALACGAVFLVAQPALAAGSGAEAWRDYARRSMMPDYAWNDAPSAQSLAPTLRDAVLGAQRQSLTMWLSADAASSVQRSLTLSFGGAAGLHAPLAAPATVAQPLDLDARVSPLHSRFLDATFEQDFGRSSRFSVSALVASQYFATPGFGLLQGMMSEPALQRIHDVRPGYSESSHGQGMGASVYQSLGQDLAWRLAAQSRLDMGTFESVRGIHAEPGDFDLPGRVGAQLEWNASANTVLAAGVERVFYSDITPFTSPALPARLLSLMADGHAPAFEWRNLTVYSLEGRVSHGTAGQWVLRYTTRQQPSPSADLYRRALDSEYTNRNFVLGYRHGLGQWGQVAVMASYAPSMAFLGAGPVFSPASTYARGARAEVEARWVLPF